MAAAATGFRPRDSRLHGHAGDGDERAGAAKRARKLGVDTRVQSAIPMASVCEPLHPPPGAAGTWRRGGSSCSPRAPAIPTSRPTRRRAARRRNGLRCAVQGHQRRRRLYRRPEEGLGREALRNVSFGRVLGDNLKVMDAAAVALCRDNNIPIVVFNIRAARQSCPGAGRERDGDDRPERRVERCPRTTKQISSAACTARSRS